MYFVLRPQWPILCRRKTRTEKYYIIYSFLHFLSFKKKRSVIISTGCFTQTCLFCKYEYLYQFFMGVMSSTEQMFHVVGNSSKSTPMKIYINLYEGKWPWFSLVIYCILNSVQDSVIYLVV